MKKLLLACALLSTSAYALKFEIKVDLQTKTYYKKIAKNDFLKTYSIGTGTANVIVSDDGEIMVNNTSSINERDDKNSGQKRITVSGKHSIVLKDTEIAEDGSQSNINVEIFADLNKSFTGNLKSLKVPKEELISIYKEELEKAGIDQLNGMKIDTDEFKLESDIQFNDMNCVVDSDLLTCTDAFSMNITASDE